MRKDSQGTTREQALSNRMQALHIREEDLEESFTRSGGKGGQHVNKVSTCVRLRHVPTGIEVRCSEERTQSLNRYRARVILLDKIEQKAQDAELAKRQKLEKMRRAKRKRPKHLKEKILAQKAKVGEKKRGRTFRYKGEE